MKRCTLIVTGVIHVMIVDFINTITEETRNIALCFTQRLVCQHHAFQVPYKETGKRTITDRNAHQILPLHARMSHSARYVKIYKSARAPILRLCHSIIASLSLHYCVFVTPFSKPTYMEIFD